MRFTIIAFTLLAWSCSTKREETTNVLPDKRPLDFVIETHYGGGLRDTSAGAFISADSSFLRTHSKDTTIARPLTVSSLELDTLYAILKRNNFDKIESTIDSTVLDAESYYIGVYWNKNQNSVLVSDGGGSPVKEEWRTQWRAINQYLNSLVVR